MMCSGFGGIIASCMHECMVGYINCCMQTYLCILGFAFGIGMENWKGWGCDCGCLTLVY